MLDSSFTQAFKRERLNDGELTKAQKRRVVELCNSFSTNHIDECRILLKLAPEHESYVHNYGADLMNDDFLNAIYSYHSFFKEADARFLVYEMTKVFSAFFNDLLLAVRRKSITLGEIKAFLESPPEYSDEQNQKECLVFFGNDTISRGIIIAKSVVRSPSGIEVTVQDINSNVIGLKRKSELYLHEERGMYKNPDPSDPNPIYVFKIDCDDSKAREKFNTFNAKAESIPKYKYGDELSKTRYFALYNSLVRVALTFFGEAQTQFYEKRKNAEREEEENEEKAEKAFLYSINTL